MIPVQVREDHVGDLGRRDAQPAQAVEELAAVPLLVLVLAEPGVDQHHPVTGPEQVAAADQLYVPRVVHIVPALVPSVRVDGDVEDIPGDLVSVPVIHRVDGERANSHATSVRSAGYHKPSYPVTANGFSQLPVTRSSVPRDGYGEGVIAAQISHLRVDLNKFVMHPLPGR